MKRVIVFDLWKTLVGEPDNLAGYFEVLNSALKGKLNKADLKKAVEQLVMSRPAELSEALPQVCEIFGISDPVVINQALKNWQSSCDQCFLFPETLSVLSALKKNCRLALITNTSKYGWQQVEKKFGLSRWFDLLVLSFEQGTVKPDQKLFEYVEEKLPSDEYWMIGDSLKSDLEPAALLGWQTLSSTFLRGIKSRRKVLDLLVDRLNISQESQKIVDLKEVVNFLNKK